jgi:hypothetical protein
MGRALIESGVRGRQVEKRLRLRQGMEPRAGDARDSAQDEGVVGLAGRLSAAEEAGVGGRVHADRELAQLGELRRGRYNDGRQLPPRG